MVIGNVNTNINNIQARKVQIVPLTANFSNLSEKSNVPINSTTIAQANTKTQLSTTNPTRTVQGKGGTSVLGARITVSPTKSTTTVDVTPREVNVQLPTLTSGTKLKVTANPIPKIPIKSSRQMNYFCEWNLCKRLFSNKPDLKNHLIKDHVNSSIGKDKITDDLVVVKMEV